MKSDSFVPVERIENCIYTLRGQRVMLDQDLAMLYEVETKALNQAVKRNADRFPVDFAFRLTDLEWKSLRSQIVTSNKGRGGRQYLPYVFSEHGALMLANILKSERAIHMSIEVIRAFNHLRRLSASHEALAKEAKEIKTFMLKHSHATDQEFQRVWKAIERLSAPRSDGRRIGFKLN